MKAKILILPVLIIAILFSSGCVSTGNIVNDGSTSTPAETPQPEASIGDKVTIDDFSYIVTDAMKLPYIGEGYLGVEAKGMFVILIVSVENSGKKSEYLSYNNFKLLDSKGREYETDTTASIYMSQMGYTPLPIFDKIGPGLTSEGGIVFDVPADDTGLRLKISGGMLEGSGYIKIGDVGNL